MDPPPTTADAHSDTFPPAANTKLRLMCSYNGHIVPRPHDKSLCYAGGDTRIVAVDRRTAAETLSSFTAHLSRTLYNNYPFSLKYQLPNEDLDSLISVTTDEDLHNMIEEHDRIISSRRPSRIRLFLFPSKTESVGSGLLDQKTESWFCDALKNTKIMRRGLSDESGLVNGLMDLDCVGHSDPSVVGRVESSVPESMVLETSSSFGSTSSSVSMSNLPPIGVHGEVKVPSSGSIESDNAVATAFSHPHIGYYQDPLRGITVSSDNVEAETVVTDPSSGIQFLKPVQASGYQLAPQLDQIQHPQEMQYFHPGTHYIPQYAPGPLPISSYYPMYHPPLNQPHHGHYQQNPPYPIYLLPVRKTQPYNMSSHPVAELPAKVYSTVQAATPLVSPPPELKPQRSDGPLELHNQTQNVAVASNLTDNYDNNDFDENIVYNQIYKTQPSAPQLPLQYPAMTKPTTVLLSEASKLLHTENVKQQIGISQPQ